MNIQHFEVGMKKAFMTVLALALLSGLVFGLVRHRQNTVPQQNQVEVWQFTYLKALPGQRERLERFITLNWFGPDERARRKGYIDGFLLLRGSEGDPAWDLLVIDIFPSEEARVLARERYRTEIMPGHEKQLVDGFDFNELGLVAGERTTGPVSGHVEAVRRGL